MQINLKSFIDQQLTAEQRLGAELLKSLGLDGFMADGMTLMDIFGAPGNSAMGGSYGAEVEQVRGWNYTTILAKSLQFGVGQVGVFCPLWLAEAVAAAHGEEYKAANWFTGTEQYGVPEGWVRAPMQHRIAKLLHRPNPWCDTAQMLFSMAQQIETHGVCHFLVLPNSAGLPQELWVIPRSCIHANSPSVKFPEGSYTIHNLSRISYMTRSNDGEPRSLQEALARLSNREYSAKWIITTGYPSLVYADDFSSPSSALADVLDTDTEISRSRRNTLNKQMTNGPRLEPLPGVTLQKGEQEKILEEFEAQNTGPGNQGRPWFQPAAVKVVNDAHSAREMEYVDSANQSRDHVTGQRLWSSAMMGMGEAGGYAQVVAIIKMTARLVLQPMMRIFSGQLSIGLQTFFDDPQSDFCVLIQAASIDDPEQKHREWGTLMEARAAKKGEVRTAFNLAPFGDERDEEIAGADEPAAAPGADPLAALLGGEPNKVPQKGENGGDVGPEAPGIGGAQPMDKTPDTSKTDSVFGSLSRQQFERNRKAIMGTLEQFQANTLREKTAIATLKTLGLTQEQAQEFIDSVKEDPPVTNPNAGPATPPPEASALFARMLVTLSDVDKHAHHAATSPHNSLKEPTPEQKESGKYRKGKLRVAGLQIEIENPAGSMRSGTDADGNEWMVEMVSHYGYILGTNGYDSEKLDVFVAEGTDSLFDGPVFVINQSKPDGSFDEHKCVIGCQNKEAAIGEYVSNYNRGGHKRIMSVIQMSLPAFKGWIFDPAGGPFEGQLDKATAALYENEPKPTEQSHVPYAEIAGRMKAAAFIGGHVQSMKAQSATVDKSPDKLSENYRYADLNDLRIQSALLESPQVGKDGGIIVPEPIATMLQAEYEAQFPNTDDFTIVRGRLHEFDEPGIIVDDDDEARAMLIADILLDLFGDDAHTSLADSEDARVLTKMFAKAWDETKHTRHPKGADDGGKFAPKDSPEAVSAVRSAIVAILTNDVGQPTAADLVDRLSALSANRLREVKEHYQIPGKAKTKRDLVASIVLSLEAIRKQIAPEPADVSKVDQAALKEIGSEFLDKITPDENGNLIQPTPSKAPVVYDPDIHPPEWSTIPVELRQQIETNWMKDQLVEIRNSDHMRSQFESLAMEEALKSVAALPESEVANGILSQVQAIPGREDATVKEIVDGLSTSDKEVTAIADQFRADTQVEIAQKLLDGQSTWLKDKIAKEIRRRRSEIDEGFLINRAFERGDLDAVWQKQSEQMLKSLGWTPQNLADIVGAPEDSTVSYHWIPQRDAIGIKVHGEGIEMLRYLYRNQDGDLILQNANIKLSDDKPKGLGLQIFSQAVGNAKSLGVSRIETLALKSDTSIGYAVWPQFGYDAPIAEIWKDEVKQQVRSQFPRAGSIRDIFDSPGGKKWWWENGETLMSAEFDLSDESRSLRTLNDYMGSKKRKRDAVYHSAT